jgi:phosphate:Na+ symporter
VRKNGAGIEKQSSERHLERLRHGRAESLLLHDLKPINADIVSVARPIIDDLSLLIESRLRDAG